MGQPVKLSDALVLDARETGSIAERSIAGQIEFWARLGRAIEPLLAGDRVLALRRAGDERPLSHLMSSVDTEPGRHRVAELLATQPYPHYAQAEGRPGLLVRTEQDGTRTIGRFVKGEFRSSASQGSGRASHARSRRRRSR